MAYQGQLEFCLMIAACIAKSLGRGSGALISISRRNLIAAIVGVCILSAAIGAGVTLLAKTGPAGTAGVTGARGPRGFPGPQGPKGQQGSSGFGSSNFGSGSGNSEEAEEAKSEAEEAKSEAEEAKTKAEEACEATGSVC